MMTMKGRLAAVAAAAVTLTLVAVSASAQPKPAAPAPAAVGPAPAAVVLIMDRSSVLSQSAVGKDMGVQMQALFKKMQADFAPEDKQLQTDVQTFQTQAAALTPEARQKKVADIEARRAAFQKKVEARQAAVQMGAVNARGQIEKAISPILEAVMRERGANLLVDRGLVVIGSPSLDVTSLVIQRLNAALPKVTITPVAPPAAPAGKPNG